MWLQIGAVAGFLCLFVTAIYFAHKNGKKSAQLENLKAEIKREAQEQERANRIMDNVGGMSDDDVRSRLRDISSKQ